MALNLADRLLTIAVTATVTSAAWIVAQGVDLSASAGAAGERVSGVVAGSSPRAVPAAHPTPVVEPQAIDGASLLIPVAGVEPGELSNTFTDARGGGARLHEALDIMAPTGTPVLAAAAGTVEKLFRSDDGGNTIYVRSTDRRTIHYYAHLQSYAPGLREGQSIEIGASLGTVGWSGNASPDAPHLHFAVMRTTPDATWWEPATAINPYPLLVRGN